jgi:hypothetical protein
MRAYLVLALAVAAAWVSPARAAVSPCTLLAAAVHDEPAWSIRLSRHTFTPRAGAPGAAS